MKIRRILYILILLMIIQAFVHAEGWLGVEIRNPDKDVADKFKMHWVDYENPRGVEVTIVYMDSPAEKLGIKRGDVIEYLSMNIGAIELGLFSIKTYPKYYDKYVKNNVNGTTTIQWKTFENGKRKTKKGKAIITSKPDLIITRKVYELESKGDDLKKEGKLEEAYQKYLEASCHIDTNENRLRTRSKCIKTYRMLGKSTEIPEASKKEFYVASELFKESKDTSKHGEIIEKFWAASSIAPWWPDTYFNLGLLFEQLNDYSTAILYYKLYLEADPNAKDKADVEKKIYLLEYKLKESN